MLNLLLSIGRYSILRQVVTAFNRDNLVITQKSPGPGESGLPDEGARQILRGVYPERSECAQDDSQGICHPERSEGSQANLWVITRDNKRVYLESVVEKEAGGCPSSGSCLPPIVGGTEIAFIILPLV